MPKLKQLLLSGGALVNTAGAILGNWKNGIGATAGLPSSSKSMRSDDAAVWAFSHGGAASVSRDSELRLRWGDSLLLDDVLSLPVSLAADVEEEEDWAVSCTTGHATCGKSCMSRVNKWAAEQTVARRRHDLRFRRAPCCSFVPDTGILSYLIYGGVGVLGMRAECRADARRRQPRGCAECPCLVAIGCVCVRERELSVCAACSKYVA